MQETIKLKDLEEKVKICEISLGINKKKVFIGVKKLRYGELADRLYYIMEEGKCNNYDEMINCLKKLDKSLILYIIPAEEKEFYETLQKEGMLLVNYIKTNNERFIPEGLKNPNETKLDKIGAKQCLKLCYNEIKKIQEEYSMPNNDIINKIEKYILSDYTDEKEVIFETEDDSDLFQKKENPSEKEIIKYRKNFSQAF
ncbi:hypothetical protein JW949_03090 [Candidatus Woesearchaeota archaeon]|nr:hypothetical protein [Candidatus Woesearchaeota archaeon]